MKEAQRPTPWKAIRNSAMILGLVSGCTGPLATRSPVEEFASPTQPALTETLGETAVPTKSIAPTETHTPTPEPTPTQEIAKPSITHGLRPENAASEILENGTWVVKNNAGKVTATWNVEKSVWDYSVENIKVAYAFMGLEVDRSIIEPYLGQLPPDDPATHFKNLETGEPAPYGIGPEIGVESFGLAGKRTTPRTEFFARFRGITPIDNYDSVVILDVPHSVDKSTIVTLRTNSKGFYMEYSPNDNMVYPSGSGLFVYTDDSIQTANQSLIGKQILFTIDTNLSVGITGRTYNIALKSDLVAEAFLAYFRDPSTPPPVYVRGEDYTQNINVTPMIIPESQLP